LPRSKFREDVTVIGVPLTEICNATYSDPRQRQLFKNIMYIGALSMLLDLDAAVIETLIGEQYRSKPQLQAPNIEAEIQRDFGFRPNFELGKELLEENDGAGNTFKATAKPVLIGTAVVGATTLIFSIIMALTHGLSSGIEKLGSPGLRRSSQSMCRSKVSPTHRGRWGRPSWLRMSSDDGTAMVAKVAGRVEARAVPWVTVIAGTR
jgi:hypothetical protein